MHNPKLTNAIRVTLVYLVAGSLWILVSDWLVAQIARPDQISWYQTYKGWIFIAITATLLFFEMKRSNEKIQAQADLLDQTSDAVIITDLDFRITGWNKAAETIYGWSADEAINQPIAQLLSTQYPGRSREAVFHQFFQQGSWAGEVIQQHKDGTPRYIFASLSLLKDQKGEQIGLMALNHDITGRKQAEDALKDSEAEKTALLSAIPDMIVRMSRDGVYLDVQPAKDFEPLVAPEQLRGKNVAEILPPELAQESLEYIKQALKSGQVQSFEYQLNKNEHMRFYEARVVKMKDRDEVLSIVRDITDRKQAETLLQGYTNRLQTLHAANLALTRTLDLELVLNELLDYLRKLIPYDTANVMLLESPTSVVIRASKGYEKWLQNPDEVLGIVFNPQTNAIQKQLFETRQAILIPDVRHHPGWEHNAESGHVRSWLGVPLVAGGNLIGLYALDKAEPNFFAPAHRQLAEALAAQAAVAIQNANLFEQIQAGRNRLEQLTQALVSAQEEERRRISRELHDEAGQALTVLKLSLQMIKDDLPAEAASVRTQLSESVKLTNTTMNQIRYLAHNLRPPALDTIGLNPTLQGFCEDFAQHTHLSIEYQGQSINGLSDATKVTLYRFLQEAVNNIAKHAQATHVQVILQQENKGVSLTVKDNGRGFDPQTVLAASVRLSGIGLLGIQERVRLLSGQLIIQSQFEQGTTVTVQIPES